MGSKACREINLAAGNVDWDKFLASVAQEYKHGRAESEIDWKTTVNTCAVQAAPSESWFAGLANLFTLKQLPTLAFRLLVVAIALWLIFFRAGQNTKEITPEFRALQQETRTLREENSKLQAEVEKAKLSSEKASQDLTSQHNDLEQKVARLERESRPVSVTAAARTKAAPPANQLAPGESLAALLSQLEDTGEVTPTPATQAARQVLDSRDARATLRGARSEQKPIPLSPRFTAIRLTTPTLRWESIPAAEQYQIRIVSRDQKETDKLVWESGVVRQTQTTLPSGVLRRGKVYFWQVEALVDGKPHLSPAVGFWVISNNVLREVATTERDYKDSALVLAATYEANGLYEEALIEVHKLSTKNKNMADLAQVMSRRLQLQMERE
jgi:hypothetical protein